MTSTIQIDWREWKDWENAVRKLNELLAPHRVQIQNKTKHGDDFLTLKSESPSPPMTATPTPDDGALAACPFASCGSTNVAVIKMDDTDYVCACQSCGATGPAGTKGKQSEKRAFAIAAWNTRSPAPVSGEAAERAAEEIVSEIYSRVGEGKRELTIKEAAAIIRQHCAGAGREGGPTHI